MLTGTEFSQIWMNIYGNSLNEHGSTYQAKVDPGLGVTWGWFVGNAVNTTTTLCFSEHHGFAEDLCQVGRSWQSSWTLRFREYHRVRSNSARSMQMFGDLSMM